MPGMDMHHHSNAPLSATAKRQIDSVALAAARLAAPTAATAAGFRPVFGWIPTMGVHYVAMNRMVKSEQSTLGDPSNVMFSRIAGKDSLVGAAFAYMTAVNDSSPPKLFDGAPGWHEHPDLAPPGQRLVMLHVWFVPSPDGPFAGTNPNLPFWAAGLDAPDSLRMHDAAFSMRVRKAGLALAEVTDTTAIFRNLEQRPDVRPILVAQRDSIRALIPEFQAAQKAHDSARWDRAALEAAGHWDAIYAGYLASAKTAMGKERMERYISMLLGQHGE
ncbi:MAG TPA: hypothetical protein VN706_10510 [Gemmatimonadaceae bacterium]|nr:hypothetical protein [Gemmatimonadaceae bacterium]